MNHTIQMNQIAQHLANKGRHGDSVLVHMSPREVSGLQALARSNGTTLTINPETGLPEAFSLGSILPMAAGAALTGLSGGSLSPLAAGLITGGLGALTSGSLLKGLQMGMGAYGGAGLAGSLANLAAPAAEAATTSAPGFINPNAPSFAPSQNLFPYTSSADLATSAGMPNISNVPYVAPTNAVTQLPSGGLPEIYALPPYPEVTVTPLPPASGMPNISNVPYVAPTVAPAASQYGPGSFINQNAPSIVSPSGVFPTTGPYADAVTMPSVPQVVEPYPYANAVTQLPSGIDLSQTTLPSTTSVQPSAADLELRAQAAEREADRLAQRYTGLSPDKKYFGLQDYAGYKPTGLTYEKYGSSIGDYGTLDPYSLARPEQTVNWPGWYRTPIQSAIPVSPEVTDLPASGIPPQSYSGRIIEGARKVYQSPEELGGFLKDNLMNVGLAAYPGLFASPARIQPGKSYINPYTLEIQNLSGSPVSPTGVENEGLRYRYVAQKPYLAAQGGIVAFARGGQSQEDTEGMMLPDSGRFDRTMQTNVLPRLNRDFNNYAAGGQTFAQGGIGSQPRFLSGGGDGMSDSIPATINDHDPARLADGEFIIPADVVSHLGNGSSKAGAKRLYGMMDRVRLERTGKKRQAPKVNVKKLMPA